MEQVDHLEKLRHFLANGALPEHGALLAMVQDSIAIPARQLCMSGSPADAVGVLGAEA